MRISQWLILIWYLVTSISTAQTTFLYEMDKCKGVTLGDYGDEGTMTVSGEYNQVCTWSVPPQEFRTYTAIVMRFTELDIDCDKGYLQMNDMSGAACTLCGAYPATTCHIYADQDKCTASELWNALFQNYADCIGTSSVIHRGISGTPMELMTNTTLDVEFVTDYILYPCQGPAREGIPTLGTGKPIQKIETVNGLNDICQSVIHSTPPSVTESPKTPTETHTNISQPAQPITPIPMSGQQTTATQPPTMKPTETAAVTDPLMTILSTTKLLVQSTQHTSQTNSRSHSSETSTAASVTQIWVTTSIQQPTTQIPQQSTALYQNLTTVDPKTQLADQPVITIGLKTSTADAPHGIYSTTAITEALEFGATHHERNEETTADPQKQPESPHSTFTGFHIMAIILSLLVAIFIIVLIWRLRKRSTNKKKLQSQRTHSSEKEQQETFV